MPHKHNPISSENICGIARVLRGYMVSAYEDVALWHERDISHSSVERIILPDATQLIDYMLSRYAGVLDQLVVYPEQMKKNIELTHGLVFSQRVLTELVNKGLSREEAYDLVQALTKETMECSIDFQSLVRKNETIKKHFDPLEIDHFFTLDFYGQHTDEIYHRVFSAQGNLE
jgi:adenylosuccinate lyase